MCPLPNESVDFIAYFLALFAIAASLIPKNHNWAFKILLIIASILSLVGVVICLLCLRDFYNSLQYLLISSTIILFSPFFLKDEPLIKKQSVKSISSQEEKKDAILEHYRRWSEKISSSKK